MYVGQDPTGKGFIKIAVEKFTKEQVAAWLLIAPATALKYVYPELVGKYTPPQYDTQPGAPMPKLKRNESATTTKATEEER